MERESKRDRKKVNKGNAEENNHGKANENKGKWDVNIFRLSLNVVSYVTSKHQEFLLVLVHEIFASPNWAIVQVRIQCRINEQ